MSSAVAIIIYYVVIVMGYSWSVIQLAAKEPFDAFVLFIVTFMLQSYRNAIREQLKKG